MDTIHVMTRPERQVGQVQLITIVGISLVLMFALGLFAEFRVRASLIHWNDPVATYTTLRPALGLFSAGIFAFVVITFLDVVLSVAFCTLFVTLHRFVALLMTSLRLLYAAFQGVALVGLILARDLYAAAPTETVDLQVAHTAMQFLKLQHMGFALGLIFFGLHLILLGWLLRNVPEMPRVVVWVLFAAGIGYGLNSLALLFTPEATVVQTVIIVLFIIPMTFAELSLGGWLWVKRKRMATLLPG
ncbi:protein of unknown function [Catalinimonas alkaloidigena]|uniref:DUF4386 domain-containing protein n=1 Tax=Catalinimonas alkaloidigena TaxID=1075417 RepID=A0A1G8X384_9BACT|nr:DUF4386 domain-containing protein [Catalinimonas alkaloidigena]SDJ84921.1 protein of unknown function [Catalinimonas alkaloidigena]